VKRVLILGSAGAGKSTLARTLGSILGLPLIHLDAHFWQPGWRESPRDEWKQRVAELVRGDAWIMDGNYSRTLPERLEAADTAILLDIPRVQCLYRVVVRSIRYRGKPREDLNPGCIEQLPDWDFIRWIWWYPRDELPVVVEQLRLNAGAKDVVVLRSSAEIERYVANVERIRLNRPPDP
jgi:adenylate kinase family enzyme